MNKKDAIYIYKKRLEDVRKIYVKDYDRNNRILSFSLAFSMLFSNATYRLINSKTEEVFTNSSEVYEYINRNPYLDEEEKKSIYYIDEFVNDYYYLLDVEALKDKLPTFDIDYRKGKNDSLESSKILGSWKPNINVINFYYCNNSADISDNKSAAAHEYYHLMSAKYEGKYSECLSEGVTSLLNYEYSDFKNVDFYKKEREIARMISILVGRENLIKSYTHCDNDILKNSLHKISTDDDVLKSLFKNIEDFHKTNLKILDYLDRTLDRKEYFEYQKITDQRYRLMVEVAKNLNHYAMSKEISHGDDFYLVLNKFLTSDIDEMQMDGKYYLTQDVEDLKIYTIKKHLNNKIYTK